MYRVGHQQQLMDIIVPHFEKYPLLTQKQADFILFKSILQMILKKDHLNIEGLKKSLVLKLR
jgi:hypothetical protein